MKYYTCEYAKFLCGIGVDEDREFLLEQLKKEFGFYYDIQEINDILACEARIYIIDNAFEGEIEGEKECIHSSHSRNIKILLNGSVYTQQDANIYACIKKEGEKIFYYIEKTNSKVLVNIQEKLIYISGGDIYNMLVYVFETLLSISIEHKGGIQFHGACFQWHDKGYIITGKSGGGKTTFMFNALKCGGKFHANDRVAVYVEEDEIVAYSIPIPVNVPINMMRSLEGWKDTDLVKMAEDNTKIRFMVSQLGEIFHNNMLHTTKIHKIIVVDYSENMPEYSVISDGKIKDYLEILSPYDENHPKWLPIFDYPDAEMVDKRVDEIRERLAICKVSGRNTFETFMKEN